jgi:hypothetical protein
MESEMADRKQRSRRGATGNARFPASLWPTALRPRRPQDRTEAVDQLRRAYPTALIDEITGASTGTVLVSVAISRDEFLVDREGQVIDLNFVVPDRAGALESGVPEAELIRGRRGSEDPDPGGS